ncbi:MAG: hypothetical protein A2Z66_03325 [Chloroflexi bacterium RBG_13_66_10]|nr:MAG: hypothetical protein A2Z66_03325 [Chloroflexi bacterium RBG_13_66_10]
MKKWTTLLVAGVAVLSAASVGTAYAQDETPAGIPWGNGAQGTGLLHDYMVEAFADALGVTADELEERLASGETLASVAVDQGISADEFPALWLEARQSALDAAVADGVITAEQADWMQSRMQAGGRGQGPMGSGMSGAMRGARGLGRGAGTGICAGLQP